MKKIRRVVIALLISCGAHFVSANVLVDDALKSANRSEQAGDAFTAAETYLRVLRLAPGNQKAKKGLERVADAAISAKTAGAREFEAAMRFADAAAELGKAADLNNRIRAAGITTTETVDLTAALDQLVDRWVANLVVEATAAEKDELWSAAVANLRQIELLRPGRDDVRTRLRGVWTAWGDRDLKEGRLRSAAQRFKEAALVPGSDGSSEFSRAAKILAQLGGSALEKGACRSAVVDLREAARLAPDAVEAGALRRAESCAVTCVSIAAVAAPEAGLEASRAEQLKSDISGRVASGGSEFLRLLDRASAGRVACEEASAPGADAVAVGAARRFRVAVAAKSQAMLRSPATSVSREFRTKHVVEEETVAESVVVIRVYEEVFKGTMTGSVTITDLRSGRTSPEIPILVSSEATAQWVKNPTTELSMVQVGKGQGAGGAASDPRLRSLSRIDDQREDARARLSVILTQDFAAEVARVVLSTIDGEIGVPDPAEVESKIDAPELGTPSG